MKENTMIDEQSLSMTMKKRQAWRKQSKKKKPVVVKKEKKKHEKAQQQKAIFCRVTMLSLYLLFWFDEYLS